MLTLRDLLKLVEDGHGQVLGIVGEPGVARSRLLYELRQHLAGERVYMEGRCLPPESMIPYLPVLALLRRYCGLIETDSPKAIVDKVHDPVLAAGIAPEGWFLPHPALGH